MDFMANKPSSGFYKVTISVEAQKADSRLIGTSGASVTVKVTTQISVESVEIGVADKDQGSAPKPSRYVRFCVICVLIIKSNYLFSF